VSDSPGRILDALYQVLIIYQREGIEEMGGDVLLFKVDAGTFKIVVGVKVLKDEKGNEATGN